MRSDTALDYAVFQLSPRRSRCELFVSGNGETEKLASGLLKPFVTHLTVAEEQVARAVQSIKLEVEKRRNEGIWFTKGTLERFVRFVSTPEVLELVITFDAEMSQLEAARKIYLQGAGNQLSGATGGDGIGASTSADTTKKELLRAIDVRLVAVKQDLTTACARASAAGFTPASVSELQFFADRFGAHRLKEACTKFIALSQKRPDLINSWKAGADDQAVRSSSESDMSIDDPSEENVPTRDNEIYHSQTKSRSEYQYQQHQDTQLQANKEQEKSPHPLTCQQSKDTLRGSSSERDDARENDGPSEGEKDKETSPKSIQASQPTRRLSVQDRISMFENKQKEQTKTSGGKVVVGKPVELRRMSSDVSSAGQVPEKAVLRRWSGASDMSVDSNSERKETESSVSTPHSTPLSQNECGMNPSTSESKDTGPLNDASTSCKLELRSLPAAVVPYKLRDQSVSQIHIEDSSGTAHLKDHTGSAMQSRASSGRSEGVSLKSQADGERQSSASFGISETAVPKGQSASLFQFKNIGSRAEDAGLKVQVPSETPSHSKSSDRAQDFIVKGQTTSKSRFKSFPGGSEQLSRDQAASGVLYRASSDVKDYAGLKDTVGSQEQLRTHLGEVENVGSKDRTGSDVHGKDRLRRVHDVGLVIESSVPSRAFPGRVDDNVELRDRPAHLKAPPSTAVGVGLKVMDPISQIQSKAFARKLESDSGKKNLAASQVDTGDMVAPQSEWNIFDGKMQETGKKDFAASPMQFGGPPAREEVSGFQGMKLRRQSSASEVSSKLPGMMGENTPIYMNFDSVFPSKQGIGTPDMYDRISAEPVDQVHKARLSKGNQERNDELQTKADELEKLFAAHKLRVPGDQSATVRRSKATEVQVDKGGTNMHMKSVETTPVQFPEKGSQFRTSSNVSEFDVGSLSGTVDNWDYATTLKQNISEVSYSEDSRGKFYDKYMQKRDVKLREEWSSKGVQKEAKLRAMQDNLERSKAEMMARFAWSDDRMDSTLYARRRAEKLRSFNIRSMKNRDQHPIESLQSDDDEDSSDFLEQSLSGQEIGETFSGDGSSRSIQSKRLLTNRSMSSSTARTSAALLSRSSVKHSNISSGRRRTQTDNPLVQSVPNFSDFRKENTKPLSGASKITARSQFRNARSKSTSEELHLIKEDKSKRPQSMRKSTANPGPGDLKDSLPLNSDGVVLTPIKFDKDQTEQSHYSRVPKSGESKRFLRKGNGIGPGAGAGIAKMKASVSIEDLKTEDETSELADQLEDSMELVEDEEHEESEVLIDEELNSVNYLVDSDSERQGITEEAEKFGDLESENGEVLRSPCSIDPDSVEEVAASLPSVFHASEGLVHDSPAESPASWNSRGHHPFLYTHETSDIDAFAESPMGSPASWNSHPLTQMDADAARMRKKWGNAQKPYIVANASNHQSRKDVTKGFKRLLKFGRKSRGTDSVVDWISATTSEGDDDTEDGRDLANRSSEDLRKSRMGFPQDGFNDGELFNEQVHVLSSSIPTPPANFKLREDHLSGSSLKAPRSFFSLSSFRSKGSESKPR